MSAIRARAEQASEEALAPETKASAAAPDPQVTPLVKRLERASYAAWSGMSVFLIAAHYLWWAR